MTDDDDNLSEQSDHTGRVHRLRHERVVRSKAAIAADLAMEWLDIPAAVELAMPVLYGVSWGSEGAEANIKPLDDWMYKNDLIEERKGGRYVQKALLREALEKRKRSTSGNLEVAVIEPDRRPAAEHADAEAASPSATEDMAETEPAAPAAKRTVARVSETRLTTWYEKYLDGGARPDDRRDFLAAKGKFGEAVTQILVRTMRRAVLERRGRLNRGRPALK